MQKINRKIKKINTSIRSQTTLTYTTHNLIIHADILTYRQLTPHIYGHTTRLHVTKRPYQRPPQGLEFTNVFFRLKLTDGKLLILIIISC